MVTYILTSMISEGFRGNVAEMFQQTIKKPNKFAFVASEFEMMHEKTDRYFDFFLNMFRKNHNGVLIGMSAGSINMAKTSICTMSLRHYEQKIYEGLGWVDISVEPHFVRNNLSDELMELSKKYRIYGLCDESIIVCENGKTHFYGEIYEIQNGKIELLQNLRE